MLRIIQVIHTFVVSADNLVEAQKKIAESISVHKLSGVTLTQRQIKSSDPFRLTEEE